jgi:uncharacterized protein (TIGR00251 family)
MMILLEETSEGIILPVKAQPGARRNAVVGEHAGALKVAVTQAPEQGKANDAIIEVFVDLLGLKRNQLVSGATSPKKRFLVTGVSLHELRQRIQHLLGE